MQNFIKLVKDAGIEIAYKIEDLEDGNKMYNN